MKKLIHMASRLCGVLILSTLFAACSSPATQFMLLIESDLEVDSELSNLQVKVEWKDSESKPAQTVSENITLSPFETPSEGTHLLPLSIAVVPLPDNTSGEVAFTVTAIHAVSTGTAASSRSLFNREAKTRFVSGERKLLSMFLAKRCVAEICGEGETCTENGCAPSAVNPDDLPPAPNLNPREIELGNIPPSMPDVEFTNSAPRRGDPLTCTVTKASIIKGDDNYLPEYKYEWARLLDGGQWTAVEVADSKQNTFVSSTIVPAKGESWKCLVSAGLGQVYGGAAEAIVTIQNTPPTIDSVMITPDVIYASNTTLTAVYAGWKDPDGDAEAVRYKWTRETSTGTITTLGTDAQIAVSGQNRGDTFTVSVVPFDGEQEGEEVPAKKVVQNSVPTATGVRLSQPGRPDGFNQYFALTNIQLPELECRVADRVDPDQDPPRDTYEWKRKRPGENWIPITTGISPDGSRLTIAHSGIEQGDEVVCGVELKDTVSTDPEGIRYSNPRTANTIPVAPQPVIGPLYPQAGEDLECDIATELLTASDIDDHPLTIQYSWSRENDGLISLSSGPILTSTTVNVNAGDRWHCNVAYFDGLDVGPSREASVGILRNDLIAYWPLDESSNPGTEVLGRHPGSLENGSLSSIAARPGARHTNALNFESGAYLTVSENSDFAGLDQVTICAWVLPSNTPPSLDNQPILVRARTNSNDNDLTPFHLWLADDNRLYFKVKTPEASQVCGGPDVKTEVSSQNWTHVCGRYDGARLTTYINGRRYDPGALVSGPAGVGQGNLGQIFIGGNGNLGSFSRALDDIKIWSTALTENEICFQAEGRECLQMKYSPQAGLMFSQNEVPVKLFNRCEDIGDCQQVQRQTNLDDPKCNYASGPNDRIEYPMNCVNKNGAEATCALYSSRLPTDSEWTTEASNGGIQRYPWGSLEATCDQAIMNDMNLGLGCGFEGPTLACVKPSGTSENGLCDMAGNLQEWTDSATTGEPARLMGGHYGSNSAALLATSVVIPSLGDEQDPSNGFRCVQDLPGSFARPALSCLEIERNHPNPVSGWYYVTFNSGQATRVWCQMSTGLTWIKRIMNDGSSLYFTQTEVTVGDYKRCVDGQSFCPTSAYDSRLDCNFSTNQNRFDHPMNCVSKIGAESFCRDWAGARLPAPEEWAAESTDETLRRYPWGASPAPSCTNVVMNPTIQPPGCGENGSWPVCSKISGNSINGLCDMWGNVGEWTTRCTGTNPAQCVAIGGDWEEDLVQRQLPFEISLSDNTKSKTIGFRCVSSSSPQ